jgi:uncharacterized RDD family membrane protein YckC
VSETLPAPEPMLTAEQVARTQPTSLIFQRWAATVVDTFVCVALFIVLGVLSGGEGSWMLPALAVSVAAYCIVLEGRWGATLGRLATKTRVVDRFGRSPGFGKAAIGTAFRLIEVNPLLIGGLPAGIAVGLSKTRQRLGDMVAGTYVLRTEDVSRVREAVDVSVF